VDNSKDAIQHLLRFLNSMCVFRYYEALEGARLEQMTLL